MLVDDFLLLRTFFSLLHFDGSLNWLDDFTYESTRKIVILEYFTRKERKFVKYQSLCHGFARYFKSNWIQDAFSVRQGKIKLSRLVFFSFLLSRANLTISHSSIILIFHFIFFLYLHLYFPSLYYRFLNEQK